VIDAMADTLAHRGPDDRGTAVGPGFGLGFRRLSIVDLVTGNQPLASEDGTLLLVCNGEIFNAPELREELLANGHRFRSQTDVEVILHLYEDRGEKLLDRINGQFAFALIDQARHRLFAARDPFGVAPLFYTVTPDSLIFGSEIKAILRYPGAPRSVDLTGLDQVLSLPGLVSPRTMFAGIASLPPGHCLNADASGVTTRCYWDLDYPATEAAADPRPADDWRDALQAALTASVRRRLQADVPVGAYLSGGLDSTLVTGLMRQQRPDPIDTFSIVFGDPLIDERDWQRMAANAFGCRHHEVALGLDAIEGLMRRAVTHAECPLKETYNTASLVLSAAARAAGVPVVLSGEGADELFAGYIGYRYDAFRRRRGGAAVDPGEAPLRRAVWGDESVFYERDFARGQAEKRTLYSPALRACRPQFDFTRHPLVDKSKLRGRHPLHQRSYLDLKLRLGDHLVGDHGDRMLLANGVEGRYPFLDIEIAELARRMPPDFKLRGFEEKHIVKQVARGLVPESIRTREKYGFNAPGSPFLLQSGVPWVRDLLAPDAIRRQGYFDPDAVAALTRRYSESGFRLNTPNEDDLLMPIITFGLFLDVFGMPAIGG
jgi:asparagine synthase (glutamine-hydrolysing)